MCAEWLQENRERQNEIIERRSCMRSCPCREVLELMVPYDQSRMFRAHLHTRHPRVTIGIGEINISSDKNVLIIRAACREDQHAENCDFDDAQDSANHHAIPNPQVPMRNPKFKLTFPLSRLVMRICYASMHKQNGPVAQRLEQGTHNPLVPGSNPGGPSLRFGVPRGSEGCHAVTK